MDRKRWKKIMIVLLCLIMACPSTTILMDTKKVGAATATLNISASITATKLKVRTKASTTSAQLSVSKEKVALLKGTTVTILSEKTVSKQKWYYVSFKWKGKQKKGYVLSDYVSLKLKKTVEATVNSSSKVKIRKAAGSKTYLKASGKTITLANKTKLTITKESTKNNVKYFCVKFKYSKKTYTGYLEASKVKFTVPKKLIDKGKVTTDKLRVRTGAGTTYAQLKDSKGSAVYLKKDTEVSIYSVKEVATVFWYEVEFTYNNKTMSGYISGDYVKLDSEEDEESDNTDETTEEDPTTDQPTTDNPTTDQPTTDQPTTDQPTTDQPTTDNPATGEPTPSVPDAKPLTDAEFEQMLTEQGFPESYKPALRALHSQHPYWKFEAFHSGLDWETSIQKESVVSKNLIPNSKNIAWKSMETGAYKWETDTFVPYDGSTWVTASKEIVAYYMDPRNFLTEQGIFQFELLAYQPAYQTLSGLNHILNGTPMAGVSYTYMDDAGISQIKSYADTFIDAAAYSGVSPYHLASRVKQEVITSKKDFSSSVTGTVSGYEGLYNFFNIGAYHSTEPGGAIANGLKFAANGTTNASTNALYKIPWTSPYRAILGGAYFVGSTYINRGQNTIFLEKFNLTSKTTYGHQYMANVQAAASESSKTYTAYSAMNDVPLVFSIPVYLNMPSTPAPLPADKLNPNNWLKTLTVDGYTLTPTFDPAVQTYDLIVDATTESITVNGTAASRKASIIGTGIIPILNGTNEVVISVTAENGDKRDYMIRVVRLSM